ncbi:MAG: NAD(P)H-dependent oxidoreductase [Verrucomicrobia bacterium]|nr:NAD(P)H-dependent oxidoreductase [Verrucomicrobiota bacterium]MDE3099671.1 NAD(P)H-dependent oxidoreductase [Verrucomicrobiota bacterium]
MNPITNDRLLEALRWRYATKRFDPAKKIPGETWETLEQALVLTPSSYGLQPYQFVVMTEGPKRTELLAHSWDQRQVVDCSHYVVFAAKIRMTEADVDRWVHRLAQVRQTPAAALAAYRGMMIGDVVHGSRGKTAHEWAARQAYIALGNLMTCAAMLGVDACPMEGIVPAEYDRALGLAQNGLATVVACALGYRADQDKYAAVPKARFAPAELVRRI